jgi:hypothetical protein
MVVLVKGTEKSLRLQVLRFKNMRLDFVVPNKSECSELKGEIELANEAGRESFREKSF